ncbi:hypothetical protein KUTeg_020390 [Tegillarca granosa]|uniref:FAS1 domain-containing protein n=1 Tax=Tegillarca granosa TaxID=220873 RepID=A0ABQ9E7R4_TEGGR|nr:hypothetical protein KUTeg_020390 [Tegillarca granosa]
MQSMQQRGKGGLDQHLLTLKYKRNFTIFAPVDSAFTHTPADALRNLLTDHSRLTDVLKYHVVSGNVMSSAVRNDLLLPSLFSGKKIRLNDYDSGRVVTATGSKITQVDLQASNGVIHLIDRLMYPIPEESALQYLASKPNFTQLAYNAIRANIATELQALMNYHIVKGTFYSAGLRNGENIQTMNGKDVRVRIKDGGIVL